jgi:hypothetical protein
MGHFPKKRASSLSIERLLEKSKEKNVVYIRKKRLERLKFTEWRIWKLFRINWG